MSMIYALVSRGQSTVLSSFTPFAGNFQNIAMDVYFIYKLGFIQNKFRKDFWSICDC